MKRFYKKDGKLFFHFQNGLFELNDIATEAHKREYRSAFERFKASEGKTIEEVKEAVIEASKPSAIERLKAKIVTTKKPRAKKEK